jgi:hypothetical protein
MDSSYEVHIESMGEGKVHAKGAQGKQHILLIKLIAALHQHHLIAK